MWFVRIVCSTTSTCSYYVVCMLTFPCLYSALATPAEVINHYYCFLSDNLDNNVVCQMMHTLKLLNEEDTKILATLNSEYQKNTFLLNRLIVTDSNIIKEFCQALCDTENYQKLGAMLISGKTICFAS